MLMSSNTLCPLWSCSEIPPLGKFDLYNKFMEILQWRIVFALKISVFIYF